MTKEELDEIENSFYRAEDNYDLAEWARLIIPELISEIRKLSIDKQPE